MVREDKFKMYGLEIKITESYNFLDLEVFPHNKWYWIQKHEEYFRDLFFVPDLFDVMIYLIRLIKPESILYEGLLQNTYAFTLPYYEKNHKIINKDLCKNLEENDNVLLWMYGDKLMILSTKKEVYEILSKNNNDFIKTFKDVLKLVIERVEKLEKEVGVCA